MKRFLTSMITLLLCAAGFAQIKTIEWSAEVKHNGQDKYSIILTGQIADGVHTYGTEEDAQYPTSIEFEPSDSYALDGQLYELGTKTEYEGLKVYFKTIRIAQDIIVKSENAVVAGELTWLGCTDTSCYSPEYWEFNIPVEETADASAASDHQTVISGTEETSEGGFNWALIIEAILWGFAALLTPCVFPMVPMTVSFFMKGASSPAAGRFKASMYGLFIVLLYTVPISVIILITRLVGGDAVTADIFNWLATHWLPNILFFIVFMVFAASFFGAFEIVLPSKLVNKSDKGADKGGLLGIFFMSLTLVLVSFSCTGPIVGSVLIKATQGQFWEPMI